MPSRGSTPTGEPSSSSISVHNPAFEQDDNDNTHLQRKDKTRANGNYGSISVPEDSLDHDGRLNQDGQENEDSLGPGGPWRLPICVIFILVMVLSCVAVLILLIMTPEFAQRSFETGVIFDLKEASIVNATQEDSVNVLAMHVAGSITLRDQAYTLASTAAWILGSIGIGHSALLVYHAPSSFIIGSQSSADHAAMGTIHLPPLELSSDSRSTPFDFITRFIVDNDKELMLFAQDAVASKQVAWQLTGPVRLQLGWFSAKVDFDKQVTLEGMDGLKKASLQSVEFPGTHPRGGIALGGAVEIYNPSSTLSLRLGDVDFGIYLPNDHGNDKLIAVVRAEDANLLGQQNNVFDIHGRTIPISNNDRQGNELMDRFLSSYLHGNTSIVHVRGSPFGPDDDPQESSSSTTPPWLRKALQSLTLEIPFPGTKQSDLIRSLELSNIKIDFSDSGRPVISADIAAMLQKPDEMQFSINVTEIYPRVFLYLEADSKEPFGKLIPDKPSPAHTTEDDDLPPGMLKVTSRISRAPFTVMPGKDDEFQKFIGKIFNGKRGTVYVRGTADAMVDSAFGHLTIHDLEFKGQIDSQGMNGMQDPPPRVTSISLEHGATDALYIQSELEIVNPSDVQVNMGLIHFSLEFGGQTIGEIILQELKLEPNTSNKMSTRGRLFADNPVPVVDYIGKYISAEADTPLTISGRHPNATFSDLLLPLVRSMEFTVIPPLFDEPPLLAAMQMNVLSSTAVLWLRNPFSHIRLEMIQLNATAVYETTEIGTAHANFHDPGEGWTEPVMLPPLLCSSSSSNTAADNCSAITVQTPKIPVMTKKLGLDMIKKALGGEIELSIDSIVTIQIDDLVLQDLRYKRNHLTAKVNKGF